MNSLSEKNIYILTFRVAHWGMSNDGLAFQYAKGKIFVSVLVARVMCLHFDMQEEDILEHSNDKCHSCTLKSTRRPLCT